jgi:D-sedoheptulose 7-phosphate isomerase
LIRRSQFLDYVDRFKATRVLVIGPAVVEIDVHCAVNRVAPDRVMPVFCVENRTVHPGGAALVSATIRNLGAEVDLLAPVGAGAPGGQLRDLLKELGIGLIEGGNGTTRTPELFRYLSAGRQLLQLRRGWKRGEFVDLAGRLEKTRSDDRKYDAICIVDATPASLSPDDFDCVSAFANAHSIPLIFDGAGGELLSHLGAAESSASSIVLNEGESKLIVEDAPSDHVDRLRHLCATVAPDVLLTLGRNGAVAGRRIEDGSDHSCEITPITTPAHALSDRRGVGFVTSGVFALCMSRAVGAATEEAAFLACSAASAAAAVPGPKLITIDDILGLAYHEIAEQVADGVEVFERIARERLPIIDRAARLLLDAYGNGNQVLVFGNGGSAAEANHLVTELTGQFRKKRAALPAISLSSNDALATCIANDYGFEDLFARQVEAFCKPGDIVIAMSTSGRSPNVVRGLEEARRRGGKTIGFTGDREGDMDELCDVLLAVPSKSTPRIQEAHLFVIHVMCEMLDQRVDDEGRLHPSASEM